MLIVNVGMLTIQVGADGDFIGSFGHNIPFTVESATVIISTSTASTFTMTIRLHSATGNWDTIQSN